MSSADRWLLPEGIEEILPPQARRLEQQRRQFLDLCQSWGYEQVFPPLVEYLESLLTGAGNDLALQTFKLTDQLTGRMMGVRADMTPQVARMDAHTLNREGPTRLCYAGHVLHTKPASLMDSRSQIQLGAELYGYAGIAADIEVISLMLNTLAGIGLKELHLDLGHVAIYRELAAKAGLTGDLEYQLFDIYQRKSIPELASFLDAHVKDDSLQLKFLSLGQLAGNKKVLVDARACLGDVSESIERAISDLEAIAEAVQALFPGVSLYFDLGELRGYHYHTGPVFSVYVPGLGQSIANGGRYDHIGEVFGRARPATGFSADLARLIKLTSVGDMPDRELIFAPVSEQADLQEQVAALRAQGRQVVQGLPGQKVSPEQMGCTHRLSLSDGCWKVEKI